MGNLDVIFSNNDNQESASYVIYIKEFTMDIGPREDVKPLGGSKISYYL